MTDQPGPPANREPEREPERDPYAPGPTSPAPPPAPSPPPPLPPQYQPPGYPPPGYQQGGYAQPAYQQPGYPPAGYAAYGAGATGARNGLGVAALICGIIGVLVGFTVILFFLAVLLGVLALVFGIIGRRRAARGEATNRGAATAGLVLGIIAVLMGIGGLVVIIVVANSDSVGNLFDCLEEAGSDQDAVDDCERRFEDELTN